MAALEITSDMLRAKDYINNTRLNVFLTGKAGSGKTTFLRYLLSICKKRAMIVASTGVAAINAGGVTIHSLLQIPPMLFTPETRKEFETQRMRESKRKVLRMLDLLVIDEISMVRADLLDAVDFVLRRVRQINEPFGGVQLLMVGDLQQLPPVLTNNEATLYNKYYKTPYFYGSIALNMSGFATVELTKIFRQTEENFLEILNAVRNNAMTMEILEKLNNRYSPSYKPQDGVVRVCAKTQQVDAINQKKLAELKTPEFVFKGKVEGKFPADYPADIELVLKEGTQVMFTRNNTRLNTFNGKIGTIVELTKDKIVVDCKGERINVEQETWENISYESNDKSGTIEGNVVGKYTQYPLRYAWAITVHKSQGLTFDEALIDVNAAFSPGQVYVALSRCRSLEGLHLSSKISANAIFTDRTVDMFMAHQLDVVAKQVEQNLPQYKCDYYISILQQAFSFKEMTESLETLCMDLIGGGFEKKQPDLAKGIEELNKLFNEKVVRVSNAFRREYTNTIMNSVSIESNQELAERLTKAATYFSDNIEALPNPFLLAGKVEIDGQDIQELYDVQSYEYLKGLYVAQQVMQKIKKEGFTPDTFLATRSVAESDFEKRGISVFGEKAKASAAKTTTTFVDKELVGKLSEWRKRKSEETNKPAFMILHQAPIISIAINKPLDKIALQKIEGIGKMKIEQYGDEIITLVRDYIKNQKADAEKIEVKQSEKPVPAPKPKKPSTYDITLEMVERGMTAEEISAARSISVSTIYGHIMKFAYEGKIDLSDYYNLESYKKFCTKIESDPEMKTADLEEMFGSEKLSFYLQLNEFATLDEEAEKVEFSPSGTLADDVLALVNQGHSIVEIGYILKQSPRTVEDKIFDLLKSDAIDISKFVSQKKKDVITSLIASYKEEQNATFLRQRLPYYCSFFDIRCVKLMKAKEAETKEKK